MKLETLRKYIRYTDIPYPVLIERARRGGLSVKEVCLYLWKMRRILARGRKIVEKTP